VQRDVSLLKHGASKLNVAGPNQIRHVEVEKRDGLTFSQNGAILNHNA
jgi:hypothetical protein